VHILATSREPLGVDGEHVYRVPSLSVGPVLGGPSEAYTPDAVTLFFERARTHKPGFVLDESTTPVVVSICRHLDGIPLALELAAARLRTLSLVDVERGLEDRIRLATGGSRVALPRHRTLRATMEWSYEALGDRDRTMLQRLAVFAGGFDVPAAEVVCSQALVNPFEVTDGLSYMRGKSCSS
jgi:predicted ATPase